MKGQTLLPRTLGFKLLAFAAALVVIPWAIFGVIAYSSSRSILEQVIGRYLAREASTAAKRLEETLTVERDAVRSAAQQDVMRDLRVGDIDKRVSNFLATHKEAHPSCIDLAVIDAARRVIASSDPGLIDTSPSWAALASGRLQGPDLMLGPLPMVLPVPGSRSPTERPTLLFAATVPDPDVPRRTIGLLVGVYDWDALTAVTQDVRDDLSALGLDADVLITNERGAVIRHGSGDLTPGEPAAATARSEADVLVDRAGLDEADRDEPPRTGVLIGRGRLGPGFPAWSVLVIEPLGSALAPVDRMVRRLAIAAGFTLMVALGIATLGARRVAAPIRDLTRAIRNLGRTGGAADRIPVRSRDEVGMLAREFNRMASDLDRARQQLVEAAKFAFAGELAAGIAHEIRTPLGVLRTSTQILERSLAHEQDPEVTELVQMMRAEVDRVDGVVSELLDLARPRHAQLAPVALADPVFRAADFVEPQAREKEIAVRRTEEHPGAVVLGDSELIYQVALNLLVNAIQALGAGGHLEVRIMAGTDGGSAFAVCDDGPGIPDDARERIFLPFVALREGGTGLGLTFVQRVVQEHRGRITVDTAIGRGTTFRIDFPRMESA